LKRKILWAPWRIKYIQGLNTQKGECFICHNLKNPQEDEQNFVLWRTSSSIVVLNHYPYNNGHLLIAPARHVGELGQLNDDELMDIMKLIRETQKVLSLVLKPHGFNVGMNFGRCAGAGLPEHLHIHVVPRWDGDTSFINICSDTKIVSQSLIELLSQLKQASKEHNLPQL
jgi:ATP adenylyltransferase